MPEQRPAPCSESHRAIEERLSRRPPRPGRSCRFPARHPARWRTRTPTFRYSSRPRFLPLDVLILAHDAFLFVATRSYRSGLSDITRSSPLRLSLTPAPMHRLQSGDVLVSGMIDRDVLAAHIRRQLGIRVHSITPFREGAEFTVFRAVIGAGDKVVLKTAPHEDLGNAKRSFVLRACPSAPGRGTGPLPALAGNSGSGQHRPVDRRPVPVPDPGVRGA